MGKRTGRSMSVRMSKETQITDCVRDGNLVVIELWQQHQVMSTANAQENPNGLRSKSRLVPISIGFCQEDVSRAFRVLLVPPR